MEMPSSGFTRTAWSKERRSSRRSRTRASFQGSNTPRGSGGSRTPLSSALARCARSIAVFYQTDTHFDGRWVDKAALVRAGVERVGARCLFHWVVLRAPIGTRSHNRAGYSHLLGFSREATLDRAQPFCDVLAEAGPATWTRGMGLHACRVACEAVRASCASRTILDPFCGHGTVLAVANELGFDAIGVELGRRRAKRARALTVEQLVARAVAVEEEEEER